MTIPPVYLPSMPTLDNYQYVIHWFVRPGVVNSAIIASVSTAFSLLIGCFAAYGLARFVFRGNKFLSQWILSTRMMPPIAILLPLFLMINRIRLVDTLFVIVILHALFNVSFVVWMMKDFFREIPIEIEESALVDGCSRLKILFIIVLPLSAPGLVVTGFFCFIFSWNEFLMAFVFSRTKAVTLPVKIFDLARSVVGLEWGRLASLTTLGVLPVIALALFLQRYIVRGMTMGAVKK